MNTAQLRHNIRGMHRLPVRPDVAAGILSLLGGAAEPTPEALVDWVRRDPVLTARVLGEAQPAATSKAPLLEAVSALGSDGLREVVWPCAIAQAFQTNAPDSMLLHFWKHALITALYADGVARWLESPVSAWAWPAGLLHDIGKFAFHALSAERYREARDGALASGESLIDAEQAAFGASHALAGKWLAERWCVPPGLTAAIWFHHHAPQRIGEAFGDSKLLSILRLANNLAHARAGMDQPGAEALVSDTLLTRAGCTRDALREIIPEVEHELIRLGYSSQGADRLRKAVQSSLTAPGVAARHERARLEAELHAAQRELTVRDRLDAARTPEDVLDALACEAAARGGNQRAVLVARIGEPALCYAAMWSADHGSETAMLEHDEAPPSWPALEQHTLEALLSDHADGALASCWVEGMYMRGALVGRIVVWPGAEPAAPRGPAVAAELKTLCAAAMAALERRMHEECTVQLAETLAESALMEDQTHFVAPLPRSAPIPAIVPHSEPPPESREDKAEFEALAAGIAHSVQDPLMMIAAHTERLLDRIENAEDRRTLRTVLDQTFHARRTLDTVLAYARPTRPEPTPALINYVLRRVLGEHVDRLRDKGIRIEERYAEGLPRARIDRHQFEQALLSIMANAEDAMTQAGGVLTAETRLAPDRKGICIRIADTGTGIAHGDRGRIFSPFFTTKEGGERPGLGLTVARAIIAAHGGTLDLEDGDGPGSVFCITLPAAAPGIPDPEFSEDDPPAAADRAIAEVPRTEPLPSEIKAVEVSDPFDPIAPIGVGDPAPAPPVVRTAPASSDHPAVLIVDDDEDLREVLSETLKLGGYSVHTASDGGEALHALDQEAVSLVLLDLHMPEVGGIQVLERMKARNAAVPVIVMSSGASQEEIDCVLEQGARCYLAKPFQIRQLLAEVAVAVGDQAH